MSATSPRSLSRLTIASLEAAKDWGSRQRQRLLATRFELDPRSRIYWSARLEAPCGDGQSIRVGAESHVRGSIFVAGHGGAVHIGRWCFVGEGTRIWSAASVTVEDRVLISHDCEIHDWDAHPLDAASRHQQFRAIVERGHPPDSYGSRAAPVLIRQDAWIGFGAAIMKGVTIGARSIVAARSLVLDDVPDDTLVAGSPARVVRSLTALTDATNRAAR